MIDSVTNVPLNKIESDFLEQNNIELYVQREDLIHPEISGNKWRKLKYNLLEFQKGDYTQLLTFGGSSSNHIAATAALGKLHSIPTIGIIRGDDKIILSKTLSAAKENGMQFHFVSREEYKKRNTNEYVKYLNLQFPNSYIVPEGGANQKGILGCKEITTVHTDFDLVIVACGTGSTLCGIILNLENHQKAIGVPVLKNADFLKKELLNQLNSFNCSNKNWELKLDYHFGGYAKYSKEVHHFIDRFNLNHKIKLDPIYTGKMMCALFDLIEKKDINNSKVLAIHTGGLQGIPDFEKRYKINLFLP